MNPKVLHCPTLVGGNPQGLSRAERAVGLDSQAIVLTQNYFNYKTDKVLLSGKVNPIQFEIARWKLFFIAFRYDIIHYNFGQSIMPFCVPIKSKGTAQYSWVIRGLYFLYTSFVEFLDVRVLRWMKKVIIVTYQGDDARQGDYCNKNFKISPTQEVKDGYYNPSADIKKRKQISMFSRYADRIYALNPDLLHVLPSSAKFLPYSHIDLLDWVPVDLDVPLRKRPVMIHAPSDRGCKGSRIIIEAVDRLCSEGVEFDFVLIEGMSNQEARRQYERADILVDQLLAGWYGGVAVELMALGKPVICYIREDDLKFIPQEMKEDLPIINATPESVYEVLKYWLTEGKNNIKQMGSKSRDFVEKWHDPIKIASQLKEEYENILRKKHHTEIAKP